MSKEMESNKDLNDILVVKREKKAVEEENVSLRLKVENLNVELQELQTIVDNYRSGSLNDRVKEIANILRANFAKANLDYGVLERVVR